MESSRFRSIYGGDQIVVKIKSKIEEEINAIFSTDRPWVTIVWDDPVNLMDYVTYVFMELFSYSRERATELMMKVHTEGKAVVSEGTREEMEHDVARLLRTPYLCTVFPRIAVKKLWHRSSTDRNLSSGVKHFTDEPLFNPCCFT